MSKDPGVIRRILCPTDFSECADAALRYAVALAAKVGASVTLLHVYSVPIFPVPDGMVPMAPGELAQLLTKVTAELERRRAAVASEGGPPVDVRATEGDPATMILRLSGEREFDLIVMGIHGRSGMRRLLAGVVAERVVREAACPVLTLRG